MSFAGLQTYAAEEIDKDLGKWLITGFQGSGKTTLASTLAGFGKTLFIDMVGEYGTRSFSGSEYANNIEVVRPQSVTELDDLFYALNGGEHDYKAVILDSLSSVQNLTIKFLTGASETSVREIQMGAKPVKINIWGQSKSILSDIATFWYGLASSSRNNPVHVAMTVQPKPITSEEGQGILGYDIDVQSGARSVIRASSDYTVFCDVERSPEPPTIGPNGELTPQPMRHILRFGADPYYNTKARIPHALQGKVPTILGRNSRLDLVAISKYLGIGA